MNAAPELVPSVWVEDDEVVIHDRLNHNPGRINVRVIQMAWHCANQRDDAKATLDGRSYHRDTLRAALDLVNNLPACANCASPHASRRMDDGRDFCPGCCSAATAFDDREDY